MSVLQVFLPVDGPVCLVPLLSVDGAGEKPKGFCAYVANRQHLGCFDSLQKLTLTVQVIFLSLTYLLRKYFLGILNVRKFK